MFGIRYKNELLDLLPGQSPVVEWISTAFNDSRELLGSYSYPIEGAPSPKNNRLLGHGNQLSQRLSRRDITVMIELFDMPWKECILSYEVDDGIYKMDLKIDNGVFARKMKEIDLTQIFIETTSTGAFSDHKWELVGVDTNSTIAAIANAITGPGAASWTMYPYKNDNIFGDFTGEDGTQQYSQPLYINRWPPLTGSSLEADIAETWYSFSFYLTWVIEKVCDYLGFQATGDFLENTFVKSLTIDNNAIFNMEDVFSNEGFKLGPARHLPKIKIPDFFKYLRNEYKLILYFDSDTKKAHFNFSENVITSPDRISLDGYIGKGFKNKRQDVTGYEIIQGIDEADEMYKLLPYVKNYFIGSGDEKQPIELKIGTCFMTSFVNIKQVGGGTIRTPIKSQVGNAYSDRAVGSQAHNLQGYGRNEFSLRLLSYRGMHLDTNGFEYPYAVSDGLAVDGVTELTQSLWLGGDTGTLENYHKNFYVFFLRSEPVELIGDLPNIILNRLSPLKKVRFPSEEGIHFEAMMDKLQFTPDRKKTYLKSRITLYPIYSQSAVDIQAYQDFNPGDVALPEVVFVKVVHENLETTYRRPFLSGKIKFNELVDVVLLFYSDLAGTIPVAVNGLVVNLMVHRRGDIAWADTPLTITAYGERHVVEYNARRWYDPKNGGVQTWSWEINSGNGYKAIF